MPTDTTVDEVATRLVGALSDYRADQTVEHADAVTAARLQLCEAFVAAGWTAPPARLQQMARDRELLRQRPERIELQRAIPYPTPARG